MTLLKVLAKQPGRLLDERARERQFPQAKVKWVDAESALHILCASRHWWQVAEGIPFLIDAGADKEARDQHGLTPLHVALKNGHPPRFYNKHAARRLIRSGADVNAVTSLGQPCLAMTSDPGLLELLVGQGATLSVSALFSAVKSKDQDWLQKLLSLGVDPNARASPRISESDAVRSTETLEWLYTWEHRPDDLACDAELYILDYIVERRHGQYAQNPQPDRVTRLPMLRTLLSFGADPYRTFEAPISRLTHNRNQTKDDEEHTIIHSALAEGTYFEPFLEPPDLDLERRDAHGRTLLLAACSRAWASGPDMSLTLTIDGEQRTMSIAQHLLRRGADISATDNLGNNAIHTCFISGGRTRDTIATVIDKAPHLVSRTNAQGDSPFHLALRAHNPLLIRQMLLTGVDTTVPDSSGNTSLHHAARWLGIREFIGLPANLPGDANGPYEAVLQVDLALLHHIISLGVPISSRNSEGVTPLGSYVSAFVERHRFHELEKFKSELDVFLSAGADLRCRDGKQQTLLHVLVSQPLKQRPIPRGGKGTVDMSVARVYEYLVGKGLDPWAEDEGQRTSLDVAAVNGHVEVVELFRKGGGLGGHEGGTEVKA